MRKFQNQPYPVSPNVTFPFFFFNMVRLSPIFDFGLALQAAGNMAFAGGKIRELTNLEDVKGKWRSRAIAPVIPASSRVFLFSNMASATKKTCWYLCFYVVTLFDKNFLHTLFCFYFAFVSLVHRSSHGFFLAAILNIISISISVI